MNQTESPDKKNNHRKKYNLILVVLLLPFVVSLSGSIYGKAKTVYNNYHFHYIFDQRVSSGLKGRAYLASATQMQEDVTNGRNTAIVQAAKKVGPAVVTIKTSTTIKSQRYISPYHNDYFDDFLRDFFRDSPEQRDYKQQGQGSGVIITENGYILTNEHVIYGADEIMVKLPDGNEYKGKVEASDEDSDIALVKIEDKDKKFPFAVLGNSDDLQIGEWVIAIGNPFGFIVNDPHPTVTVGVVSAVDRMIQAGKPNGDIREYNNLIQTDAAINPGNSGGPLVNILGEVIGINTAIFSTSGGSEGVGFAIPINAARRVKDDLLQHGRVIRPMIGIQLQSIDKKWAKYYNLKEEKGVLVASVIPGSPAEKSGIKKGDVVLKIDGKAVEDAKDMIEKVQGRKIGDKINLEIVREEKNMNIEVILEEKGTFGKVEKPKFILGVEVADITSELLQQYRLSDSEGVLITDIDMGSEAFKNGLRKGDVIKEINRKQIKTAEDFKRILEKLKAGDVVNIVVNRKGMLLLTNFVMK